MSRARGTYSTVENWVIDTAPTLPGVAGWVLLKIAAQSNYKRKTMTAGQLMDGLGYDPRTLDKACSFLVAEGYVLCANGEHVLRGACTDLAQALRKPRTSLAKQSASGTAKTRIYSGITSHNKKEEEGIEGKELKEQKNNTAPAEPDHDIVTAQDRTAPGQKNEPEENSSPAPTSPDGETAHAARQDMPDASPVQTRPPVGVKSEATSTEKVPGGGAGVVENPVENPPTEQQRMFEALAVCCYGGLDGLTDEARGRVGRAGKSLLKAEYHPADVPQIVAWLRTNESWRTGALAPQTVAEFAPRWRNAVRPAAAPGRTLRLPAVTTFSPDSPLARRQAR